MVNGEYPDLNRKHTVPHTVVLPIELYPPLYDINIIQIIFISYYVGAIRTLNIKYQKFMTYLLVHNIYLPTTIYIYSNNFILIYHILLCISIPVVLFI